MRFNATLAFLFGLLTALAAEPLAIPDFTAGAVAPKKGSHDWNLGPTGLRGWMFSHKLETSMARQIYITEVAPGSPADGVIRQGDVILGVGDQPFGSDPRKVMGQAISKVEGGASDGNLELICWRDGMTQKRKVPLRKLGNYAATAPFDCAKSKRILERGCELLARRMKENPEAGNPIQRCYNALALLASGKPEFFPVVRQQVESFRDYSDPQRRSLHSWFYGPINLLIAEYTLATKDPEYLPDLERITSEIVAGQSKVGSWGHRFVQSKNNRLAGYGMMNAPGLPLTASLVLARKAGIGGEKLDEAIDKSARLVRFYVGKGSVPYGDHHPWIQNHDDNGKNGIAANVFDWLGDEEAARYFSRMCVACHGAERDTGHTGNFFNILWALPGVALSGPHASGQWMKEFGWYYDLARQWDGGFRHQGPPNEKGDSYKNWDATGPYLLAYAQASQHIHLTGKGRGDQLYVTKAEAQSLVADGRGWSPLDRHGSYRKMSGRELIKRLGSWSPVVRERAAMALAETKRYKTGKLVALLESGDPDSKLGACQAVAAIGEPAGAAVPALTAALDSEELWLRVKAAEALAATGKAGRVALPRLLRMLAEGEGRDDPRGMQQRYLTFAIFDRRKGMLRGGLGGIDRAELREGIRAALKNQDGRARGTVGKVFTKLKPAEIRPLLPAIYEAVTEPAPSGIMFADEIRMEGLRVLSRYRISEALPLSLSLIRLEDWGLRNRLKPCLECLRTYGKHAAPMKAQIEDLREKLESGRRKGKHPTELELIDEILKSFETPGEARGTLESLK